MSAIGLTHEQERAAARRTGSLLLAAGAGSGKTAVLVERFARAVVEDGTPPGRVLAITFTERAAGELRERVRSRLLELGRREAARESEAAFVSTFHGFCARLLRAHPLQAGVEPSFRILEEAFAGSLRERAFADALARFQASEGELAVDLVAAYGVDPLRAIVLGAYAQLRSQGRREPRLPQVPDTTEEPAARACRLIDRLLGDFGEAYDLCKRARVALDFDDLELLAADLLGGGAIGEAWAQRFELLMVDEFQDTNQRQLQILAALDRDNLFTVGDELQSIYSFRHAKVALFRERGERLAVDDASLALTHNFRSRPPILLAVQRIFAERMGRRFAPLEPMREPAQDRAPAVELLLCDRGGWEGASAEALLAALPQAPPWRQAEARLLAARVRELVSEHSVLPGEVVVLLRALGDLPVYEAALRDVGVPTAAAVGGFWSHQQVADLLAWLRALANPLDELALYSTLASPLVGISSDGLALIAGFARTAELPVWQAIEQRGQELAALLSQGLSGEHGDGERLARFAGLFAAERVELALHPIAGLLARAVAAGDYERHLLTFEDAPRRLATLHKLLRLARDYEAQEGRDLRGFLDHVDRLGSSLDGREADAVAGEHVDAVRLMSIHAAKGLEFPVVCVADLGRDPNLRQPDLLVDADRRVGLRLASLEEPEPAPALDFEELCEERRAAQEEEEDRVLYVACTRARERLLLSGAVSFERWPAPRPGLAPISWLAPALVGDVRAMVADETLPEGPVTVQVGEGLAVRCLLASARAPAPIESGAAERSADGQDPPIARPFATSRPPEGPQGPEASTPAGRLPGHPAPQRDPTPGRDPVPLDDADAAISYTSLAELERCGYRYYLERVLRMPERRSQEHETAAGQLDARVRGTIAHALLEAVDFGHPRAPTTREVERLARRMGARVSPAQRREIVELLSAALASEPAAALAGVRNPRREHPFAFSLEPSPAGTAREPLVTGFLDLMAERGDGTLLIVDYKSDRLGEGEDLELLVRRDYELQRLVYALAAIEAGAAEVEVAHWFLERPGRWVSARFAAAARESLREQLLARVAAARARGFAVSGAPHRELCLTCPGRGGLCSWGETHTLRTRDTTLAVSP